MTYQCVLDSKISGVLDRHLTSVGTHSSQGNVLSGHINSIVQCSLNCRQVQRCWCDNHIDHLLVMLQTIEDTLWEILSKFSVTIALPVASNEELPWISEAFGVLTHSG